ncbi:MAG TPA: hypothetical protein ENI70_02030, partial [Candidatus Peregrinibacteria bacterium]|nr:hypothetical protein [Candidatus Peregrinibacteria bacterium]
MNIAKRKSSPSLLTEITRKELIALIQEAVAPSFQRVEERLVNLEKGQESLEKNQKLFGERQTNFEVRLDNLEVSLVEVHKDLIIFKDDATTNFDNIFTELKKREEEYLILRSQVKDWDVLKRDTQKNAKAIKKIQEKVESLYKKVADLRERVL